MPVPETTVHYLEIVTPDAAAAASFYEQLHGWRFQQLGPALGNAYVAELPDGSRCGIRAPMHELEKPVVRNYVRVADLKAAAARAEQLGAMLALPYMEIPGHGTIAIFIHGGVEQGLWQL